MKADNAFPEVVLEVKPWLTGSNHGDVALREFCETKLAQKFPDAALTFLDAILTENSFLIDTFEFSTDLVLKIPKVMDSGLSAFVGSVRGFHIAAVCG